MSADQKISDNSPIQVILENRAGLQSLTELHQINPFDLGYDDRVIYLRALEKQTAWLNAWMQKAIVAVAGAKATHATSSFSAPDEEKREEVSTALRLSPSTAQSKIDVARVITQTLPEVADALANGEISPAHASTIAREADNFLTHGGDQKLLTIITQDAISHAEFHTPAQVASRVRQTISYVQPSALEKKAELAASDRRVVMNPERDGMATVVAFLPAQDAQTLMLALNKIARKKAKQIKGEDGISNEREDHFDSEIRIDNLRADALADLAADYLNRNKENDLNHGRPATLNLTIDLPTLLGLQENPALLAGYGPIPASVARTLAADAKWRRFIVDPTTGNLLDFGRLTYEPPQPLVDYLLARDQICRFPGCRQPGRLSDIDHAVPWDRGGATSSKNMGLLCRRHHRLKTHGGWKLVSHEDGSCTWTSPAGQTIQVAARPVGELA
jgi:hypothetical protein